MSSQCSMGNKEEKREAFPSSLTSLFNLENIYYFPTCSGGTISLHHSITHFPLDIWKSGGGGGGLPYEKAGDARREI